METIDKIIYGVCIAYGIIGVVAGFVILIKAMAL